MGTLLIVLLALLGTTVAANNCANNDACVLSCEGCDPGKDKTIDPNDCHNYYICDVDGAPTTLPFTCPDGTHFSRFTHECVQGEECDGCIGGVDGLCHYECGVQYPTHSHPYECGQYYDCSSKVYQSCPPEKPYFNGDTCESDVSRCCSCQPSCTSASFNTNLMDPADCTRYCYCSVEGIATDCGTCTSGNFDPLSQKCSDNMVCSTPPSCINHIGTDWCINAYTCTDIGYFGKCLRSCVEEYYHCSSTEIGKRVQPYTCSLSNEVFDPISKHCVLPQYCPYSLYDGSNTTILTEH